MEVQSTIQNEGKAGDKAYMRAYMKEYIQASPLIECECGALFKAYNKTIHQKTQKHQRYVHNLEKIGLNDLQLLKLEIIDLKNMVKKLTDKR